ncbi:lysine--tRNA ligase [Oscillatoria amoena NRMC-F 0135]|nr:lysine--tRNA ligase [Oscillatoria laete-virens]MDL5048164.1 lysine--tRNA ligase [Oscillatoria amoena NRMC-F 0135]MDL5053056.1 lysine--tRNA ligase [Oscillatoria laete-virens NRMC-F 0139]
MEETNDLIQLRIQKLDTLRAAGIDPFGKRFDTTHTIRDARGFFTSDASEESLAGINVCVAGRMMTRRDMGKSAFADIKDSSGRMQVYVQKNTLGEDAYKVFTGLLDLGDIVGVKGTLFRTKTGEPSIKVTEFMLLSKSLHPLPDKWHGLADQEQRYRQRYVDLIVNDDVREVFKKRSALVAGIREFLSSRGFMEVETPMMQAIPGGAAARPFMTHHNALDIDLYMRIAPELYLKRLLVGGFEKVFELNRNFRNEGISRKHNPEFTMLEAYWAYADFGLMADLVEEMIRALALKINGCLTIETKDGEGNVVKAIDLSGPWPRVRYQDAIQKVAGDDWFTLPVAEKRAKCREWGIEVSDQMEDFEVTNQVFEKKVEAVTMNPVFYTHLPVELVPLAKQNADDPGLVDVYELVINGQEISPGYSELNDPLVQRRRLEEQAGEETQKLDEDFLEALSYGMPPAGGIGVGIDRLAILLTGVESIRDVILFPLMKPKES